MMPVDVDVPPRVRAPDAPNAEPRRWVHHILGLMVLAIVAGTGVGVALGEIHRNATTPRPPAQAAIRTFQASSVRTFYVSRRISGAPVTLDRLSVAGHGGTAVIEWYCGSWSPLTARAATTFVLYLDGRALASSISSGRGGEYDTRAGVVRWVGPLSTGSHVLSLRIDSSTGPVAVPLVVGRAPVQEGVSITEHVGS